MQIERAQDGLKVRYKHFIGVIRFINTQEETVDIYVLYPLNTPSPLLEGIPVKEVHEYKDFRDTERDSRGYDKWSYTANTESKIMQNKNENKFFRKDDYTDAFNYAVDLANEVKHDVSIRKSKNFNQSGFTVTLADRDSQYNSEIVKPGDPKMTTKSSKPAGSNEAKVNGVQIDHRHYFTVVFPNSSAYWGDFDNFEDAQDYANHMSSVYPKKGKAEVAFFNNGILERLGVSEAKMKAKTEAANKEFMGITFDSYAKMGDGTIFAPICSACIALYGIPGSSIKFKTDNDKFDTCGVKGCKYDADYIVVIPRDDKDIINNRLVRTDESVESTGTVDSLIDKLIREFVWQGVDKLEAMAIVQDMSIKEIRNALAKKEGKQKTENAVVKVQRDAQHGNELRVSLADNGNIDDSVLGNFKSLYLAKFGDNAFYVQPGREDLFQQELAQYGVKAVQESKQKTEGRVEYKGWEIYTILQNGEVSGHATRITPERTRETKWSGWYRTDNEDEVVNFIKGRIDTLEGLEGKQRTEAPMPKLAPKKAKKSTVTKADRDEKAPEPEDEKEQDKEKDADDTDDLGIENILDNDSLGEEEPESEGEIEDNNEEDDDLFAGLDDFSFDFDMDGMDTDEIDGEGDNSENPIEDKIDDLVEQFRNNLHGIVDELETVLTDAEKEEDEIEEQILLSLNDIDPSDLPPVVDDVQVEINKAKRDELKSLEDGDAPDNPEDDVEVNEDGSRTDVTPEEAIHVPDEGETGAKDGIPNKYKIKK